jgi:3-(methylthio)propanoyl-CoA dehydrogenase
MANFYKDNPDIRACLDGIDMGRMAALREGDFHEAREYDFAPRDAAEARAQYEVIMDLAGEITGSFVAPRAKNIDREGNSYLDGDVILHPDMKACIERFRDAELMGLSIERKYGGLNLPGVVKTAVIEIVARGDASLMNIVGLQDIAETIEEFAEEPIKAETLPKLTSGKSTAAMVLTEPDAGSDLQSVRLRAEPVDEAKGLWKLSGAKRFITNGCGEVLLVLARSEPGNTGGRGLSMFLVEKGKGVRIRRIEDKLGIHGSPTCEIQFNGAPGRLVGARKRGLIDAGMGMMNGARVAIAAQGIGIAEAAAREAVQYAKVRAQFGKNIIEFPAVYEMLANMRIQIEAARAITYRAAYHVEELRDVNRQIGRLDKPTPELRAKEKELSRLCAVLTPFAKYYATEIANSVTFNAIQVFGGSGFMRDYPVERHYRDARITNIYEGTSQLQVVAAIGGVRSGIAKKHIEDILAAADKTPSADLAAAVRALVPHLDSAVQSAVKQTDEAFHDIYARPIVDQAIDLYICALFALQAGVDAKHKRPMAETFLSGAKHRMKCREEVVKEGSREMIEKHKAIIGL